MFDLHLVKVFVFDGFAGTSELSAQHDNHGNLKFLFGDIFRKSVFLTFTACTCNVLLPEHIYIPYLNAIWEEEGCLAHCTVGEATPLPPRFAI